MTGAGHLRETAAELLLDHPVLVIGSRQAVHHGLVEVTLLLRKAARGPCRLGGGMRLGHRLGASRRRASEYALFAVLRSVSRLSWLAGPLMNLIRTLTGQTHFPLISSKTDIMSSLPIHKEAAYSVQSQHTHTTQSRCSRPRQSSRPGSCSPRLGNNSCGSPCRSRRSRASKRRSLGRGLEGRGSPSSACPGACGPARWAAEARGRPESQSQWAPHRPQGGRPRGKGGRRRSSSCVCARRAEGRGCGCLPGGRRGRG